MIAKFVIAGNFKRGYGMSLRLLGFAAMSAVLAAVAGAREIDAKIPSADEIRELASSAYTFAYPLVLMELTRRQDADRRRRAGLPAANQFVHARAFPDERSRLVIRPNADTLYSVAWLDLSSEPVLLHVPDTHDRYYVMQLLDAWTETFDLPGKRTRGTGEQTFAIAGPAWQGTLPAGAQRIDAPTNTVWLIGRTQVNGAGDYGAVHAIQDGYALMPLSGNAKDSPPTEARGPGPRTDAVDPPPVQAARMSAREFFQIFAELLAKNPPHSQDAPQMRKLARIGIVPGQTFAPDAFGAAGLAALADGAKQAADRLANLGAQRAAGDRNHGWTQGFGKAVGRYGVHYESRAEVARLGLGALPPEEAIYFSCSLNGARAYTLHFPADQLPAVRAFWSLTLYGEDGYFVANSLHRFAIGDRDALKFNADGSLDLFIQHEPPGGDGEANWLPAPQGNFNLSLRLYWPSEKVRGRWIPPPVKQSTQSSLPLLPEKAT
jgi:hypothetical protein